MVIIYDMGNPKQLRYKYIVNILLIKLYMSIITFIH